ncbi:MULTISPECIES: O-antigen polymerase [Mesoflavibacter]|uniref:Oligosaccharide repeat unit polymerase n=1 Tax=Mesoflavibacter profundi TaxID=2708110 RepID=A0ABT4S1H6_9FLAO|nr:MULTISPECIES: O-antigen polymerase [Mesoflavibacter]MDA0177915.1 oligosaccharide repeat unit polymerase [Mesoflavibacter profundi]QIJ88875.1 hypothetical protein C7H62_1066 [Mesoflavibacter sp. HG96]QIJ91603.1 hypothetical protein C7H56_1066 [Mesoflavibacter sp. HG37]
MKINVTLSVKIVFYLLFCIISNLIFGTFYHGIILISVLEIIDQIKKDHFISTYTFWNIGFIIIICLDGIISKDVIIEDTGTYNYNKTALIFLISQFIIICTYRFFEKKSSLNYVKEKVIIDIKDYLKPITLIIVIVLYLFFLYSEFPNTINSLLYSRFDLIKEKEFGGLEGANRSLINSFIYYISGFSGYILPSLFFIAFNKKFSPFLSFIFAIIPSSIIWIMYIIIGTRHHILFSFLGLAGTYALINKTKFKFKIVYFILIISGYFISNKIVDIRRHGLLNYITGNKIERYIRDTSQLSTDKTVKYMSYVVDYYDREENSYRYGKSSLAVIFFWVPRKIWNDKPPQFSYWFIREYLGGQKGFSDKFSAPGSYLAELYSDFGKIGVILISIFIGFLSNKIDLYFSKIKRIDSYKQIMILSFFLASFFFFPRQINQFFSKFVIVFIIISIIFKFNTKLVYNNSNNQLKNE